jgi:serine/threonine-protein kinase
MPGSAVSDLAGRVLAGRYLLHSAIGTGASGRVYVADDTRLRRRVAVKVLHAALAEDAAFLRRFRAEAQLAASLHHPHIVTVHDWGEDDVPFMVLELLEGGSLRSMLDEGTRLTVPQAARVGRDVASALEYAHARGILHRDIKPANLLFDEHGRVRVADFGLARALAEASWTEPVGAMFGTARYASPEQARGVQLDARSDLYSLALVLVESVTGTVPFAADTTLGTLSARTHASLTAPSELGSLAPVIDRAGALDPDDRYPDASTMRAAIADAGDALPPPGPLHLAGMNDRVDPHPTRAVPTAPVTQSAWPVEPPVAPVAAPVAASVAPKRPPTPGAAQLFDQDDIAAAPHLQPTAVAEPVAVTREPNRQRRWVPFVVATVIVITLALAAFFMARVGSAAALQVPSLVGMNGQKALTAAQHDGFTATIGPARAAPDPPGTVIQQDPAAGALTGNRHLRLVLSSGPAKVAVPNIVDKQWDQVARPALDKAGLLYDVKQQYDESHDAGIVLAVNPAPNVQLPPDSRVAVTVSQGHAPVQVPDVTNMSYDDAANALTAAHLTPKRAAKDEFSNNVKAGNVTRTDPVNGTTAPYGSTVTVYVSKGQDLVVVPNLVNRTPQNAADALAAQGLNMLVSGPYPKKPDQLVSGQDISPGTKVVRGSDVTVTFSQNGCILGFICLG